MSVHSQVDLGLLERKARQFLRRAVSSNSLVSHLYRNKPNDYFTTILNNDGIMKKYMKDSGGDPKCPLNRRLEGLYFFGRNNNPRSPFGEKRINIPATDLFNTGKNVYFADFFCMSDTDHHYMTIVVTTPGTDADTFCQEHLLALDKYDNPYIWLSPDGAQVNVTHGYYVWVEVFYTEDIDIRTGINSGRY